MPYTLGVDGADADAVSVLGPPREAPNAVVPLVDVSVPFGPGRVPSGEVDMSSGDGTTVLWRPTGPQELALVRDSGWRRWPPRLPDQPIFYPVLNEDYAITIARDWNVPASGSGYVTRFRVDSDFLRRYPPGRSVGGPSWNCGYRPRNSTSSISTSSG
ncbi:hypothetical protein GA0070618_3733 [Micromonospora echinospora]|uniref:Uncharacterized protein n=1 Tax=Micromonospora echinospora TaxID=1877 RepID=A0A1C4YA86_MICEC|nr:hypothetical protein GA0070618_3733 [Micromonospora echinospora]